MAAACTQFLHLRQARFCSSWTQNSGTHHVSDNLVPPHGAGNHMVPFHLPRSVVAHACEVDGWDSGQARGASIRYSDSSALKLRRRALVQWPPGRPQLVLIVKKPRTPAATVKLREIAAWLTARGIKVVVERAVHASEVSQYEAYQPYAHAVDFCITLGGDGTVLHLASLFEGQDAPLPPVISFAMGTLGFLTPFDVGDFPNCLARVLNSSASPLYCTLRTRKRCEMVFDGHSVVTHNVLNEVVIDRGAFPGAVLLELFVDGSFVTNIEADGLIIASPSGSTAYSMSAGGPMIAPSVPCTILTPIAPLSLSFRPLVIPESSHILVRVPPHARSYTRCSFDGKKALRMRKDSSLLVTTSLYPLPMINLGELDSDWYEGITQKLKWNQSIRQLPKLPDAGWALGSRLLQEQVVEDAEAAPVPTAEMQHAPPMWVGEVEGGGPAQQEQQEPQTLPAIPELHPPQAAAVAGNGAAA